MKLDIQLRGVSARKILGPGGAEGEEYIGGYGGYTVVHQRR